MRYYFIVAPFPLNPLFFSLECWEDFVSICADWRVTCGRFELAVAESDSKLGD